MTQFPRNTQATLAVNVSAGAATGAVTATTKGEDGVTIATGAATHVGVGGDYTFLCPPQAELNRLTTTWSGTWNAVVQSVETFDEIIGGLLFSLAEARVYKDAGLADTTAYPDADIRDARDRIADDFQNCCGVPFFPRYERETLSGSGQTWLWLPYKRPLRLVSVMVGGVAMTSPELAAVVLNPSGKLETAAAWPTGRRNIVVTWERGYRRVPLEIHRAALELTHYELISSEITDRMVTFANELGTVRLSTPGRENPTGIPLIDAVLHRLDERDVLVAFR